VSPTQRVALTRRPWVWRKEPKNREAEQNSDHGRLMQRVESVELLVRRNEVQYGGGADHRAERYSGDQSKTEHRDCGGRKKAHLLVRDDGREGRWCST
jgi:hypothetical protein